MKKIAFFCILVSALSPVVETSAQTGGRQLLTGHVPAVVARLAPLSSLAASKRLNLSIGLPLRNTEALDSLLQQIYDPSNPNFRHYLTLEQFTERFGPTESDYQGLIDFVKKQGLTVTGTYPNRVLLNVNGSVADIERVFQVRLQVYQHPKENRTFYAPDAEPSLDLAIPIADIAGLNNFGSPHSNLKTIPLDHTPGPTPNAGSGPSGTYWGNDFRAAYAPGVSLDGSGQIVGLFQYDGYYGTDITNYENQAGLPHVPLQNILLDGVSGIPGYSGNPSYVSEVSLDIEMAVAMAPGLSKVIVFEGSSIPPNSILNAMATNTLVKQFSSSWTWSGGPGGTTDNIFKQLAAQGQSYFQCSGDSDAYDSSIDDPSSITVPVDSTNIICVGATTLTMTGTGGSWASETVWNQGGGSGSSGGVSTYYAIPSWQQGISMTANLGSTSKRNLPDVAMVGDQIWVIYNGTNGPFGGTSCAAPLWAGFTALINQQATANGRPSVGLITPAIYAIGKGASYSSDFHDVTTGNNQRPGSGANFPAVTGYDLCTGWGTPNGLNLITALATPDALGILPGAGFNASGTYGGPFSPNSQVFSLTNSSGSSFNWSVINTSFWLNASPSGGTLAVAAATSVAVSLASTSNSLPPGIYTNTVQFMNLTSGVAQPRQFTLTVSPLELVRNGGFETGDFTGWTLAGDTFYTVVTNAMTVGDNNVLVNPHSGNFLAFPATFGAQGMLSQALTTLPGRAYLLSLWFNTTDGSTPNQFQVNWNGSTLTNLVNQPAFPGDGWINLQFLVNAAGTSTVLQFTYQDDPSYLALDDVSVQPVPAPVFLPLTTAPGVIDFSWFGMSNLVYQLQYKTNLAQPGWINLGSAITATNNALSASDLIGPNPQRFYRLSVLP